MWWLLMERALACDPAVLNSIPAFEAPAGERLLVRQGKATANGVPLAGARGAINSQWPVEWWKKVLPFPELQDDWQPKSMGNKRVDRIDATHIYQQVDISLLWGAFHIRRQSVARVEWLSQSSSHLQNCWQVEKPEDWSSKVQSWVNDSAWNLIGYGGWTVDAAPDGGSKVSYQFWAESSQVPADVVAYGMSKTMPTLLKAFDQRVAVVNGAAPPESCCEGL